MAEGYEKVARLMGTHCDFMILRRFRSLNAQNLLYLQAELTHLESDLQELARRDANQVGREYHQRDWWSLSHGGVQNEEANEQWETILEIRKKLDSYNDAILKNIALLQVESPREHDHQLLKSWFQRPRLGAIPLLGLDRDAWDNDKGELYALKPRPQDDTLSKWFIEKVVPAGHRYLCHRFKTPVGGDTGSDLFEYKETTLNKMLEILVTIVASLLPLSGVVILFFVQKNSFRIGVIVILSAFFSLSLALMTNARKIEIFAATSAFAAVNVVYLTNNTYLVTEKT